ncbi:uncharacterized protein N7484_004462 [Penicillium longicatenatum]|uniref:uncharacterized protein n=1 Tax=Penicillium longicatenatum TaxID=1561947 RepID=UPI00254750EC|nr:uncharacterized protein N7484_004462 [Penicillium longicatenatum]KAJ5650739.1 hypothetical protein N7484_004462 [Penicillium longicatenatum]
MASTITSAPSPLTTTFTPPADCFTDSYHMQWWDGVNYYTPVSATYTWWWVSLGARDWSTCFPSGFATATTSYFSPGLCPSGYTAAGLSEFSLDSNIETRATCCPSGYNAQTGDAWPWYSSNPCTSSNTNSDSVYVYTFNGAVTSETGTFGIQGKGISIRWQSTDFVSATSTSETLTSETSASTTSTFNGSTSKRSVSAATSAVGVAATTTGQSMSNGLSTGAKIGIGVGCGVAAVIIIIVALLAYRRRKGKSALVSDQAMAQQSGPPVEIYTPALYGNSPPSNYIDPRWQDGISRSGGSELAGSHPPIVELSSTRNAVELDSKYMSTEVDNLRQFQSKR